MKKIIPFTLILIFSVTVNSEAQVGQRWYSYDQYLNNEEAFVGYTGIYIWNDTTAVFGYSGVMPTYDTNKFTSVGLSFAPILPAWNDPTLYGSTIEVGPSDAYVIDSIRIHGSYRRNSASSLPVDTIRLSFVYGNGTAATNLPEYYLYNPLWLPLYGYDTLYFFGMHHDSLNNIASNFPGVLTAPFVQDLILSAADTSPAFDRIIALSTPFPVPAGNSASVSLTYISGDASYTPFDTVVYESGAYKYGEFFPLIEYASDGSAPIYAPYAPADSNVGYFKPEGSTDAGWGGLYIPTWAWTSGGSASALQYPVMEFHINCATCAFTDTISGITSLCVGDTTTLTIDLTGGSWSSSDPATASIDPTTGLVTGISAGVVTITYTLSGHYATTSLTINPAPLGITGTPTLCSSATTDLSDGTPGGTWSSSVTSVATVDPFTGIVTGVSAGTTEITYSTGIGCFADTLVTVYASPDPISGTLDVCSGLTSLLSDGIAGGTWTSGSTLVATVGLTTGIVTGVSAGTAVITYTLGSGCSTTATVTVSIPPVAGTITGTPTVCAGSTTALSDAAAGGVWSSSSPGIASVGGTGIVTGVAAGTATISYTVTNVCGTVYATLPVTVNPMPFAGTITGTDTICPGFSTTLADTAAGGIWSSTSTSIATVSGTGVVLGVSSGSVNIHYSVTNSCGTVTANFPLTVNTAAACALNTGQVTLQGYEQLMVFPNPNDGTFTVNLLSGSNEQVHIVITNIVGEKINELTTTANKVNDIKLTQPGIYILSATTSTGSFVAKIMVER